MKRHTIVFIILVCFYGAAQGTSKKDSIIITNPHYFSEYEQKNFETYLQSNKTDIFALSLSIDSTTNKTQEATYLKTIQNYLASNKSILVKTTDEKVKIKKLFKSAHQTFFTQYNLEATCSDFYSSGKFNCVTGSLFFSIVMDSLRIPYTIKETPTHVLLLAYPSSFSLPIESTDPNMTIYIPDESFKKRYIDFLVDSKIIQKSEVARQGIEKIFNEKYYSTIDIKPIELVGLLYYNSGIDYLNKSDFKWAFQQFEKAYLLYPSNRVKYGLELSLLAFVADMGPFSLDNLDFLAKLVNYSSNTRYRELVVREFNNYTQKYLINENDEAKYEQIYNRLIAQVNDSAVKSNISTIYFYERSRACSIKNDKEGSWKFISQGYKLNPQNLNLIARLKNEAITKLKPAFNDNHFLMIYDSLLNEFPILRNSEPIQAYEGAFYLKKAAPLFYNDDITAGEKYLKQFDAFLIRNPNCTFNPSYISSIYCNIASAYFRNKDIKKCKAVIEQGLILAPNDEDLIRKYKVNITHEIK